MPGTLHQTYLMVTDLEASVRFYRNVLELEPEKVSDRQAKFRTGAATLVLERDFDEPVLREFGLEPPGDDRGAGVIVVLEVDDVEAAYERAENAGADVRIEPRTVDWGRTLFLVADPDGYVIEVSKPV